MLYTTLSLTADRNNTLKLGSKLTGCKLIISRTAFARASITITASIVRTISIVSIARTAWLIIRNTARDVSIAITAIITTITNSVRNAITAITISIAKAAITTNTVIVANIVRTIITVSNAITTTAVLVSVLALGVSTHV